MRHYLIVGAILTAAAAGTAWAEDPLKPMLIPDATIRETDSALVKAAKMTLANRLRNGNAMHIEVAASAKPQGRLSAPSNGGGASGDYHTLAQDTSRKHSQSVADRPSEGPSAEATAAYQRNLQQQMGAAAAENDQPYGGDSSEDRTQQQLSTIPGQMQSPPPRP